MWSSFTLTSPDSPQTVRGGLEASLKGTQPLFRGRVGTDDFIVTLCYSWYERQTPTVARGRFETIPYGGTLVHVRIRPQWWYPIGLAFILGCTASNLRPASQHTDWFWPWFFAGLAGFMVVLTLISCVVEERRYQRNFARVFTPTA